MASSAAMNRSIASASPLQKLSTFKDRDTPESSPLSSTSLSSFASDSIFSPFLSPDFDPVRFSSHALSTGSAASTAEKLQEGIRLLEKQLRSDVLSRHSDLLSKLTSLRDAESALSLVRSSVSGLQSSARRIRSEIADPNRQIRTKTAQLTNIHHTSELLQSTIRILRLSRKLRESISASESDPEKLDLLKAAQLHCEILSLAGDNGLAGIDVVDEELRWVSEVGAKLRSEGMNVLERGLESLNQAEVGSGLQVFYNLGELRGTVDGLLSKYKSIGVKSISAALDMKAISSATSGGGGGFVPGGVQRSGTPQLGASLKAKDALWQRISSCVDQLHSIVVAVWHLQRVLSKKRDPFSHVLLLDEVILDGDPLLTDRVWDAFVKSFSTQMKSAFTASSFVKETFTIGYPKLYSMIVNLLERISRETDVKGVLPAISSHGKHQMLGAIEIFQTAYLAQCLSRLSDLVNSVFSASGRGIPSKEHISKIVLRIQEEIEAVQFDDRLTLLVLHEIEKVLRLLAQRAEYQISPGPDSRQVVGPATPSQLKNFALCQHLQEIHTRISSLLTNLSPNAAEALSLALGAIHGIACDSITPLFQDMNDRLESCILQIHDLHSGVESAMDNNSDAFVSPYMEELRKCIIHFRSEFLSRLLPTNANASASGGTENICTKLVRKMASRVLMFFVRHASLVRPLSESGKIRMAKDMTELEVVVGQNLFPVEQLGGPYRALRALRHVVFLETSQLEAFPLIQDLQPSVILHHLYSRGPEELKSPMQMNDLSEHKYSLWLDTVGEDQIWKGIKATLDDYAARVRSRGDKEFSPVYPIMLRLGTLLSENASMLRSL